MRNTPCPRRFRGSVGPIAPSKGSASASFTPCGRRRERDAHPERLVSCIGGDRTSGYVHAKEQLFRTLDDLNGDPRLAQLEASIMGEVNRLGIGTMGFGGRTF